MRQRSIFKPESPEIRGVCVTCGERPQSLRSSGKYRAQCSPCHADRYPDTRKYQREYAAERRKNAEFVDLERNKRRLVGYRRHKKAFCEECGFVAKESVQLDVDHVDGNKTNNDPSNLRTLCANCHRLKTYLCKNFKRRRQPSAESD